MTTPVSTVRNRSVENSSSVLSVSLSLSILLLIATRCLADNEGMTGDELKSKQKSSVVFKSQDGIKDASLKLAPEDMIWWQDAKFGMFIHWGLYAIPGKGEWYMFKGNVPAEEYAKYADRFKAKDFDADAWAKAAKDAGMKYMVLTARHHDGFALWDSPSSYQGYCSMNSAAKKDFVAEYTQACRKAGLGVGLYYSPMDWRFPGYFMPKELVENAALMKNQAYGQVEELMKNYGKIDVLWYDGGWLAHNGTDAAAAWFWEPVKLNKMVRKLQPKVVINPRSGWEGDFACAEGGEAVTGPIIEKPWEKCLNLNRVSWGYNPVQRPMTPQQIIRMLIDCVDRGGNVLLNVGPDADGVIPPSHVAILKEVGDWLHSYGESIYGTRPGPFQPEDGVYSATHKGGRIYVHVIDPVKNSELVLPALDRKIKSFLLLSNGELKGTQTETEVKLLLTNPSYDGFPAVIELVLEDACL